jgi:hypothetical protein
MRPPWTRMAPAVAVLAGRTAPGGAAERVRTVRAVLAAEVPVAPGAASPARCCLSSWWSR